MKFRIMLPCQTDDESDPSPIKSLLLPVEFHGYGCRMVLDSAFYLGSGGRLPGLKRQGMRLMPLVKFERCTSGSPTSSKP